MEHDADLSSAASGLLGVILRIGDINAQAATVTDGYPLRELAARYGRSLRTAQRGEAELIAAGYLVAHHRPGRNSLWEPRLPEHREQRTRADAHLFAVPNRSVEHDQSTTAPATSTVATATSATATPATLAGPPPPSWRDIGEPGESRELVLDDDDIATTPPAMSSSSLASPDPSPPGRRASSTTADERVVAAAYVRRQHAGRTDLDKPGVYLRIAAERMRVERGDEIRQALADGLTVDQAVQRLRDTDTDTDTDAPAQRTGALSWLDPDCEQHGPDGLYSAPGGGVAACPCLRNEPYEHDPNPRSIHRPGAALFARHRCAA